MTTSRAALASGTALLALALAGPLAHPRVASGASTDLTNALKCRAELSKQGRLYAKKRLQLLLGCVDKLLKCEVQLEVDGTNPGKCRSSAIDACTKWIGPAADSKLSVAGEKLDDSAALACLPRGLAEMLSTSAGGLYFANDADCNASADVPTLVECLREQIAEQTDEIVGQTKPRAGLLLDNAGLGGDFGDIPRPDVVDELVVATAPGNCVLVAPGTINLPLGDALRFTGDAATLPVGGGPGSNGKLTITVGSGPTASELTLKEPYGPSEAAVFGPYTAAGLIPYSINLKDSGGCNTTVSGDISVP